MRTFSPADFLPFAPVTTYGGADFLLIYRDSSNKISPLTWLDFNYCLKIAQKVAFNMASEASYVYILGAKNDLKTAKMIEFGEFLKT